MKHLSVLIQLDLIAKLFHSRNHKAPSLRTACYLYIQHSRFYLVHKFDFYTPHSIPAHLPPTDIMAQVNGNAPKIKLYTNHGCPWAHRAHIVLKELGLDYDEVIIDLNKPREPWYLEINPVSIIDYKRLKHFS